MSDADKPEESLGFDFAPAWARESADAYVSRYQGKNYDERTGREERPRREGGRVRGGAACVRARPRGHPSAAVCRGRLRGADVPRGRCVRRSSCLGNG